MPSARSRLKASSRLGPTEPVVLAWASVWQDPHLDTNSTLPRTRLEVGCLTAHPPIASSASAAGSSAHRFRWALSVIERGSLSERDAPLSRRQEAGAAGSMPPDEDAPEVPHADALDRTRDRRRSGAGPDLLRP